MLSETEFFSQITDAYEHLYDLVYLRTHPLVDALVPDSSLPAKKRARQLHHTLLEVIGELDPGPQAPAFSNEWRRHRLLTLRYVKGLNPQAVAEQLAISLRHYYRVHKAAIEDVAGILWERYAACQTQVQNREKAAQEEETPVGHLELLRLEAARMAQADRFASVANVVEGVVPLLREMMHKHSLDVRLTLPRPLPGVSVDQNLLRQMLLGLMGYLIEHAEQATIQITARIEQSAVYVALMVEPPEAIRSAGHIEERLSASEEIAALSEAHILPVYVGRAIVGFDVQLPKAERTVLVVDDNEDVLELVRSYLSPHRYRVVTAQGTQDALDKAYQLQPYAITLDLMMPEQDGWSLLQTLLNQPDTCHIPIIVCSVLKQKELALSLGATAFLGKPVTEQALLSVLEALERA